ncbi:uncharacterized protein FIBRA_09539 [Fibroporia radiculosa]|uniref:Uncharacterized protein n=1 Tax=Fibroporia radiculosa TaxID=599839 RepID=J7SD56_9APHY|nr:uncharacterized protein FIBRA_09539 [Fibroporia radiculosa]CCM07198.1 predicted protein [Fibroporia radiculosa]
MSSGLVPYNFTFTDQSPIIRFYPYRDGPVDTQWNVSYSGSSFDDWSFDNNFGVGTSSHTTTFSGAYLIFEWTGTAVWLYGEAEPGTYSVSLDEALMFPNESTFNNVLFNQTDLQYGKHNLVFTIWENEATIYGATVTTGMGESGTVVQTKNISAVIDSSEQNPFFITDGDDWSTTVLYLNQSAADHYACITTSVLYAGLTFYVNESIAFEMYGSGDWTQGLYTVQVSPELPETDAQAYLPGPSIQYSPRSHWSDLDVPKFLATGLDRNHTYRVDVTNLGANFNLGSVVLYDAVPR